MVSTSASGSLSGVSGVRLGSGSVGIAVSTFSKANGEGTGCSTTPFVAKGATLGGTGVALVSLKIGAAWKEGGEVEAVSGGEALRAALKLSFGCADGFGLEKIEGPPNVDGFAAGFGVFENIDDASRVLLVCVHIDTKPTYHLSFSRHRIMTQRVGSVQRMERMEQMTEVSRLLGDFQISL